MALNGLFCADVPLTNYSLTNINVERKIKRKRRNTSTLVYNSVIFVNENENIMKMKTRKQK